MDRCTSMNDKRIYPASAASGGNIESLHSDAVLGPCPSCQATLRFGIAKDPQTEKLVRVLMHPIPFCGYFGETDPAEIVRRVTAS